MPKVTECWNTLCLEIQDGDGRYFVKKNDLAKLDERINDLFPTILSAH